MQRSAPASPRAPPRSTDDDPDRALQRWDSSAAAARMRHSGGVAARLRASTWHCCYAVGPKPSLLLARSRPELPRDDAFQRRSARRDWSRSATPRLQRARRRAGGRCAPDAPRRLPRAVAEGPAPSSCRGACSEDARTAPPSTLTAVRAQSRGTVHGTRVHLRVRRFQTLARNRRRSCAAWPLRCAIAKTAPGQRRLSAGSAHRQPRVIIEASSRWADRAAPRRVQTERRRLSRATPQPRRLPGCGRRSSMTEFAAPPCRRPSRAP